MRRNDEVIEPTPIPTPPPPAPPPPAPTAQGDDIQPGEALRLDQAVQSPSGRYTLVYQADGNLVLYKNYPYRPRKALWASNTNGRPVGMCIMQTDGNLVIYGPTGLYIWDSSTHGNPGSRLVVQDDGNLVIYRSNGTAAWATGTVQPPLPPTGPTARGNGMSPGEVLHPNQVIHSASGRYALVHQGDGNLVLYKNYSDGQRKALWTSSTAGRSTEVCIMQHDGNLVIYGPDGEAVWSSATHGNLLARLALQDDGNLVIYSVTSSALWATDTPRIDLFHQFSGNNGWLQVTLRPTGAVRFTGHAHNSVIESVDFRMRAVVRCDQPVAVAVQKTGHLGNNVTSTTPRDNKWDETTICADVIAHYEEFERTGRLEAREEREGNLTGALQDIADIAVRWIVGSVLITPGIGSLILAGIELGSLIATGGFGSGARIIEGMLWMAGPYGTLYSFVGEGIAQIGEQSRPLTTQEYDWAQEVFAGTLPPRDKIRITDTVGGDNRWFVFPRFDGKITINVGPSAFGDPRAVDRSSFIHELVHVWQIEHEPLGAAWVADGLASQICNSLFTDVYDPGTAGPPFGHFNLEQQAKIVQRWYATGQRVDSQWYPYIEQNIRMGRV